HQLDDLGNWSRQLGRGTLGSARCCKSSSRANAGENESRLNPSASRVWSRVSRAAGKLIALNCRRLVAIQSGERQSAAGVEKPLIFPAAWSSRQWTTIFCQ